ncbi:MAG: class I poly(R)-hydroxyalkanoic acid synthase [Rhodospirillales bacterium]
MADIAIRSQRLVNEFLQRNAGGGGAGNFGMADPMSIGRAFFEMTARMMADPTKVMQAQMNLWQDYLALWQNTTQRMLGQKAGPQIEPEKGDRRFRHDDWNESEIFNFIKQSYLLSARWLQATVKDVEGLDDKTAKKVDFYTRQFVNALSPTNFVMTNPEVLRETLESRGENLVKGLRNLLDDLEEGDGRLNIRMTDNDAFEVGRNLAVTPGKVVFRNDLLELLQYAPATDTVCATPLLLITPWINKFYVLDMRPENSLIKWLVDRGHTVFVTSWVNPDEKLAKKSFADYMTEGAIAAIDAVREATDEKQVNAIGYCIGGTLLAGALSYLAEKKIDTVKSATFLTTLVDFSDVGDIGVFIDEEQVEQLEEKMKKRGYLEGHEMAGTFNMLRANDLIWSFVVNNYLMGKEPFPFDLLYWNADSTRLPAAMHSFYLREMYLANKLIEPGAIKLAGVPIDLTRIKVPVYILSTREDHIAPWKSTYAATRIYKGPVKFVLAASGHIAGVVNPPAAKKYSHWTNDKPPKDPDAWLKGAAEDAGSWWPDWDAWLKEHGEQAGPATSADASASKGGKAKGAKGAKGSKSANGKGAKAKAGQDKAAGPKMVPARTPGAGKLKALADAPGTYVKMKA